MHKKHILWIPLASLLLFPSFSVAQEDPSQSEESPATEVTSGENPSAEAPSTTSGPALEEQEMVTQEPIPDNSDVEGVRREESYGDSSLDHSVARALFEQGYFSGQDQSSKEDFVNALKNFQTLNGMEPTGEITPEVAEKLGVGSDQFSPE